MRKFTLLLTLIMLFYLLSGCAAPPDPAQVAVTTLPVYTFTTRLCEGTGITVTRLVTENVSCLHDYTLQVSQMQAIEKAELLIISGAGLEDFLEDATGSADTLCDASFGIQLLCGDHDHDHGHDHHHENDPHIWLAPVNAKIMAQNIYDALCIQFPQHSDTFAANLRSLHADLDTLQAYGEEVLSSLQSRELITFHDGFAYFASAFDLTILKAVEEESGSEASAGELIELIRLVKDHDLSAVFTERSGSDSAASVIAQETGIAVYSLDMAMAGEDYFSAMYHNIDTIKEAMG